ncbi:hypothetical protein BYT27DRAFT_7206366 [Phlegmacium glaucopus]|nr:hypothetical protein BYT27DRAFT_7206366 [Phlegmacium glaucopus]
MDRLGQFAKEATRVSQEVGTEGKLGGQALILNVEGTWREFTAVRSIVKVTKVFALGDLSKKIEVDARGEILDLKNTVNTILRALAAEVTRVTLEVGSQGKLGGQAHVSDVEGVWSNPVWNVCQSNGFLPYRSSTVTTPVARGDLTQKVGISVEGEMSTLKGSVNSMVDQLSEFAFEVTRVVFGSRDAGILGGRARVRDVQGTWVDLTRNVSVAFVNADVQEEILDLKTTVDSMPAQLGMEGWWFRVLTDNVNLVAMNLTNRRRRDGSRLGGWARATNVGGTWNGLTDNVNVMANNLTLQGKTIAVLVYPLCTAGGTIFGFDS